MTRTRAGIQFQFQWQQHSYAVSTAVNLRAVLPGEVVQITIHHVVVQTAAVVHRLPTHVEVLLHVVTVEVEAAHVESVTTRKWK
jgi:hypothetical protein